ncbi:MAG: glycosyltransferase [Ignavibacteria bacterium]|nr:glycosyltransferase [Ignavibacteria bacterium]
MAEKIKILELIDGGFLGGGQTNILSILRNINRNDFDLMVAAGEGRFGEEVLKEGVEFIQINLPKMLRTRYLSQLEELHKQHNFNLIHSHGGVAGFYSRLLKKHNPEIKTVHTIHGIHYIHSGFFRKNISLAIEQYLLQFTDMTICVTNYDMVEAFKYRIAEKSKTTVIYNGVNLSRFSNLKKNFALLDSIGFSSKNFIIGNVSRFDEQKNQQLILQAAYFLIRKYPDMRFVFVGDGKNLSRMKRLAERSELSDYVYFAGEESNLEDYYSIFDVFVLPSLWEGMPYVLLEAMAARLPILCSNIPQLLEIIKDRYSALTFDPMNVEDLFEKIEVFYKNEDMRNEIAQNAAIEATQYDETELIKSIEAVYKNVTEN